MTGFFCQKHERYCPDGVCPYCEPKPSPIPVIAVEVRKNPSLPETIEAEPVGLTSNELRELRDRFPSFFSEAVVRCACSHIVLAVGAYAEVGKDVTFRQLNVTHSYDRCVIERAHDRCVIERAP